ncbi:hypothetical protein IWW36_000124 [Coemansia brasiliensis]|uniref:superoxide dismutase n=1 Tax=Coemansia brasiliensis TaxID=2650707 RepID=A0A9W8IBX1_9FUNG|nr:hypothetical protein IWW36_000124 [Coemansia brasiliensis]
MAAYHQMAILPYDAEDGVAPFLSPQSIDFLYNMRQVELINTVNQMTAGTDFEGRTLYDTVYASSQDPTQAALANNASQAWNIDFFLQGLTNDQQPPSSLLQQTISQNFGNFERFQAVFSANALSIFSNGWTWLVMNQGGKLSVMNTYSATCPFTAIPSNNRDDVQGVTYSTIQRAHNQRPFVKLLPVLGLSMWQEAFLPDYGLDRQSYVNNFWKVVNWQTVDERMVTSGSKQQ